MKLIIRAEIFQDIDETRKINIAAFGQDAEANLVDNLRKADCETVSLVAVRDEEIVGHIMFSPVSVDNDIVGMGLAPMAVLPEFQKQGIGSLLVKEGIKQVQEKGYRLIIVLGHPEYYPKFGFEPASKYGLKSEYEVPDKVFMALIFDKNLKFENKLIKYRPEFVEV